MSDLDWTSWEARFEAFLARRQDAADAAHDVAHVRRVVRNTRAIAASEQADLEVALPAAWLHDCVPVPKDSPLRTRASRMAAEAAVSFLTRAGFPAGRIPAIAHAIEAHSFSANIPPETLEARVVQDADRLDALGAVGIARALALGAQMGRPLYDASEPFPVTRQPSDAVSSLDHFYTKLLTLESRMTTAAGRTEARRRTAFMERFLWQFAEEIGADLP